MYFGCVGTCGQIDEDAYVEKRVGVLQASDDQGISYGIEAVLVPSIDLLRRNALIYLKKNNTEI
jgi:hypothetical protein